MAATNLLVNNSNQNSRPENLFKGYIITKLSVQNSLPSEFYFIAHTNCPNSRWPPTLLINRVFDHNFQITLRGRDNFTKLVEHVFYKVIYLRVWK